MDQKIYVVFVSANVLFGIFCRFGPDWSSGLNQLSNCIGCGTSVPVQIDRLFAWNTRLILEDSEDECQRQKTNVSVLGAVADFCRFSLLRSTFDQTSNLCVRDGTMLVAILRKMHTAVALCRKSFPSKISNLDYHSLLQPSVFNLPPWSCCDALAVADLNSICRRPDMSPTRMSADINQVQGDQFVGNGYHIHSGATRRDLLSQSSATTPVRGGNRERFQSTSLERTRGSELHHQ